MCCTRRSAAARRTLYETANCIRLIFSTTRSETTAPRTFDRLFQVLRRDLTTVCDHLKLKSYILCG
jgi:hypothetical protein